MEKQEILIRPHSHNFSWGIYKFCEFPTWEDFTISRLNEDAICEIARVCICSKSYLLHVSKELRTYPEDSDYVEEINAFLQKEVIEYRYFYDDIDDEDFQEVDYIAPKNKDGVKPRSLEIWAPYETLDLDKCEVVVRDFLAKSFRFAVGNIKFDISDDIETEYKAYIENEAVFKDGFKVSFSEKLINDLSEEHKITDEKAKEILVKSLR